MALDGKLGISFDENGVITIDDMENMFTAQGGNKVSKRLHRPKKKDINGHGITIRKPDFSNNH